MCVGSYHVVLVRCGGVVREWGCGWYSDKCFREGEVGARQGVGRDGGEVMLCW